MRLVTIFALILFLISCSNEVAGVELELVDTKPVGNLGETIPKPSFQLGDTIEGPYADGSPQAQGFVDFFNKTYMPMDKQLPILSKEDVVWFPPQAAGDTSLEMVARLTAEEEKQFHNKDEVIGACDDPDTYPILCQKDFSTGEFCKACHDSALFVEGGGLQEMAYFS